MRAVKIVQVMLSVQARGAAAGLEREEHSRAEPDAAKRHRERTEARVRKGLGGGSPRADRRKDQQDYNLYEALWPLETDLLALLPKPDGEARAVYTGSINPSSINDFALAAPLNFGEFIVAHPFVHSGVIKKEMRPTENPKSYRQ
jgi:hypothetical protein